MTNKKYIRDIDQIGGNWMKENYEINLSTLAIIPYGKKKSKIIEEDANYIVDKTTTEIINDSCKFFGSSYLGRHEGTKYMIGINYKSPIIVEETNEIIFFPTSSPRFENCCWISFKHVDNYKKDENNTIILFKNGISLSLKISFGSFQNQILRSNLLRSIIRDRKIVK